MKNSLKQNCILLVSTVVLVSFGLPDGNQKGTAYKSNYISYLGCSATDSAFIDKDNFVQLVALPLCAKDSAMNYCKVISFDLTYAERGLYQDSTGLPIVVTDYSSVSCKGDTIPKNWIATFNERGYKGDTILLDNILAKSPDQKTRLCRSLKFVLK